MDEMLQFKTNFRGCFFELFARLLDEGSPFCLDFLQRDHFAMDHGESLEHT